MQLPVPVPKAEIARFCRDRGIQRLAFFGSILRDDFTSASDIDLLVDYLPGRHPGLMLFRQEDELGLVWRRRVELHTAASLSRHFRAEVLAEAWPIYEQA